MLRWLLWPWGRRDGLIGYRQVASWTSVSPLSFVFAILPEASISGRDAELFAGKWGRKRDVPFVHDWFHGYGVQFEHLAGGLLSIFGLDDSRLIGLPFWKGW